MASFRRCASCGASRSRDRAPPPRLSPSTRSPPNDLPGVEATCAVLEESDDSLNELLPIGIVQADGWFDYVAKYHAKSTKEICPGRLSSDTTAKIKDKEIQAHQALSCAGYCRSDFIVAD